VNSIPLGRLGTISPVAGVRNGAGRLFVDEGALVGTNGLWILTLADCRPGIRIAGAAGADQWTHR
jgi:hypothetical protein